MKKIAVTVLAVLLLIIHTPFSTARAEGTMQGAYIEDGERFTYYRKDASGNTYITADLDPVHVGEETLYAFNPLSYGFQIDVTVTSGYESFGSGKSCAVLVLPTALQKCCGIACYAQLENNVTLQCPTALMCSTSIGQDALVVCNSFSNTAREGVLAVNAVRGDLYSLDTPITAVREVILAPDTSSAATPGVTEITLDTLTLYFSTGEDACVCLDQLVTEYGMNTQAEDYYYTPDGVEYHYIPSVIGTEEISFVPNEYGYYEVATFDYENDFFSVDMTPQFGGQQHFPYLSFAFPVVNCIGMASYVFPQPMNYNYLAQLMWDISVKEAASQKWFAFEQFDYASYAATNDWTVTGLFFPWTMTVDGMMISPVELPEQDYFLNYAGGCVFYFLDGPSAMRFLHDFEESCKPVVESENAAIEDVSEMKSIYYAVEDNKGTIVSTALLVTDPEKGQFAYAGPFSTAELEDKYTLYNTKSDSNYTLSFYDKLGDVSVWKASPSEPDGEDTMCFRAAAVPKPGDTVYAMYISRPDGEFHIFRAENRIINAEYIGQDGSAILLLSSPIQGVYAYPGIVVDADGACVGILISENEVYLNWYS